MAATTDSQPIVISIGFKAVALIVMIFVGGLVSGILIYQQLNRNGIQTAFDETLDLSNQHVWFDNAWSCLTEAAIVIVNSGNTNVLITKVTIREIECDWIDIYHLETQIAPISSDLLRPSTELTGTTFTMVVDGIRRTFQQSTGALMLRSHWATVLIMRNVGNITAEDIPNTAVIAVFTENTFFYKEAGVEAQFTFMATEQIQITNMGFGVGSGTGWIAVTVNNTGTSPVTVNEAWVNNVRKTTTTPLLPSGGTIAANRGLVLNITSLTVTRGNNYQVKLVSSKGNQFLYSAYAPGA
jgi:hypothetical protein